MAELITGTNVYSIQHQLETQIMVEQNEIIIGIGRSIADAGESFWDAYTLNIELEAQAQIEQDMAVIAGWEDTFSSPNSFISFTSMTFTNVTTYTAYVGFASASSVAPWGVVGLVVSIGYAIWGTLEYYDAIPEITWEDIFK